MSPTLQKTSPFLETTPLCYLVPDHVALYRIFSCFGQIDTGNRSVVGCGWWKSHASRGIGLIHCNLILVIHQLPLLCVSRPWHAITKTSCASKHSTLSVQVFTWNLFPPPKVNIRLISPPDAQWRIESLTVSGAIGQSRNRVTDIYICSIDQTAVTVLSSISMEMFYLMVSFTHLTRFAQITSATTCSVSVFMEREVFRCIKLRHVLPDNHPLTIM